MNRFLTIVVTAVAGFVLVACGPAASSSSSEPSSAASAAASEAPGSSDVAGPSFTEGAVADLEALIPNTVGNMTLQKTSTRGDEFLTSGGDAGVEKFVSDLGVQPSDISIAIGFGGSADGSSLGMFVFRASGADTNRLIAAFKEANDSDRETPLVWSNTTVAGKQVEKAVDAVTDTTYYLYAKDDILFFLSGDPASTEEVIGGLP